MFMLYMYMYMYVHTYERHFSPGWASRAYTHKIMRCTACVKTISPMAGCLVHANVHAATACMNAISPMDRRLIVTSLCVCRHMCTYTCLCKTCSACVSAITPTTGCLIVIAVCVCLPGTCAPSTHGVHVVCENRAYRCVLCACTAAFLPPVCASRGWPVVPSSLRARASRVTTPVLGGRALAQRSPSSCTRPPRARYCSTP